MKLPASSYFRAIVSGVLLAVTIPGITYAHVVVTPQQATVGSRTTFNISIPNEKDVAVTALKLLIPAGIADVQPTVQAGWTIDIAKDATGAVTNITWAGGNIPAGQREDFTLRGQMPDNTTTLEWKAYQTYADGTTVAWDQKESKAAADTESETSGPLSVTEVVDDLAATPTADKANGDDTSLARTTSYAALAVSLLALIIATRRKKT